MRFEKCVPSPRGTLIFSYIRRLGSFFLFKISIFTSFQKNKYFFGMLVVVYFLFIVTPLWESVIVLCFVVRYFMSILVLQSS